MPPLVRAGLAAALLATLAVMTDRSPKAIRVGGAAPPTPSAARLSALCPRGTLPDGDVCVPVPPRERAEQRDEPDRRSRSAHDRIERRPDRPADYARYHLPTDGTSVRLVRLEHQRGDAEILHAGELDGIAGKTVVAVHAVRDGTGEREYLAIFGNLASIEAGVARGARLEDGRRLGTLAGASPAAELDYEIRRLRSGAVARALAPADFVTDARTVECDARNVLVLR
ncbi:MAG TPA: hypothetical protein VFZ53_32520 [Polyangiaceae bacterium]